MYCPNTLQPCVDDFCRGSNTCFDTGEAMLSPCPGCKNLISWEDQGDCTCDPDEEPYDEGDDER